MIKKIQTMVQLLSLSTFTRFEEQDFKMKKLENFKIIKCPKTESISIFFILLQYRYKMRW